MRTRTRRSEGRGKLEPLASSSTRRANMSSGGGHLNVRVQNPLTHVPLGSSRYTTYEVALETDNIAFNLPKSYVRRRFSEFVWFRKRLIESYPEVGVPSLPPRTLWGGQFDPHVIETRLRGLRTFLIRVLCQRLFLSDSTLHLFLQTSLGTDQITDITEGRTEKDVIETVLEAGSVSVLLKRCDSCDQSVASSSGYDSTSYSSDDSATTDRPPRPASLPVPLGGSTDLLSERTPGGGQVQGLAGPVLSSTPCEVPGRSDPAVLPLSESVSSLDSEFMQLSVSREESDMDSNLSGSSCSPPTQPVQKSLLSQSVPTMHVPRKCHHRRQRRVTFSTEVTVAKVVDKVEQSENSNVILVKVHKVKDKTKGH